MSWLPFRLVLHQLRHEWLGAACLCIAISAAIIPLLMILGLKEGTVATLRQRLAFDPVNLEVRMPQTTRLTQEEIKTIRELPGVAFCVPCPRALAASAIISPAGSITPQQESYMVPTAAGDPLLTRYNCQVPKEGEIVISAGIAEKTGLAIGDTATVTASCIEQGRLKHSTQENRVVGILPPESGVSMQSYVPLSLVIGIEEYIEGLRTGISQDSGGVIPQAVYHGIWMDKPEVIATMRAGMWAMSCPFKEHRDPHESELHTGLVSPGCKLFYNTAQFTQAEKLRRTYSLAKQNGATLMLWNPPLLATLRRAGSEQQFSITAAPAPLAFGKSALPEYLASCSDASVAGVHILQLEGDTSSVELQIQHDAGIPAGELRVSSPLLGMLHQIRHRNLNWNAQSGRFEIRNRTFSRVRLYADSLDTVEPLVISMEKLGYHATGNIAGIRRVQNLNNQLEILFRLIACIGVAGAACSLALNLFNSVIKHKREYAILCTLGMPRRKLFLFPVYEACLLSLCSLGLSFTCFHLMSKLIARLFSADIANGESLCFLSPQLHMSVISTGIFISLCAAVCAAITILKVQPSTAIREI